MSFAPKAEEIYQDSNGRKYRIVTVAEHTETGESLVIYQELFDDFRMYARPVSLFAKETDGKEAAFISFVPWRGDQTTEKAVDSGVPGERMPVAGAYAQEAVTGSTFGSTFTDKKIAGGISPAEKNSGETAGRDVPSQAPGGQSYGEPQLDPKVLEFLDADSYEARLSILAALHPRITNEMLTTLAISCDIELEKSDVEERYEELKACLVMLERYECNRLR